MSALVEGQRVRVVLEGEVRNDYGWAFTVLAGGTGAISTITRSGANHVVSVEKIEPPAIVFEVGDRIKSKGWGFELTLADDGYLQHFSSGKVQYYKYGTEEFTSERFELVYPS